MAAAPRLRAMAVVILLSAIAAVTGYSLWPAGRLYETPVGGLASVPMSDGSKVTLNTDSEIRVVLSETERLIELEHGEAFFEVAKDPHRPFVVRAGEKRVVAVGTRFSVRRDGEIVRVVVVDGKVRVENIQPERKGVVPPATLLTAGAIARASDTQLDVQARTPSEAEEHLSWRAGMLMFRNRTLAEAAEELNRYNIRKLVIRDAAVARLRIEGNFRATNVSDFVELLEKGYPVRVDSTRADEVIITTAGTSK
jgi:transmembrane sensor